jgi:hypothetical protein
LKFELDRYLKSRGGEVIEELPLDRVENQPYIHYRKGSLVMYRLKDELGEARVNAALKRYVTRFKFKGAPYPRSLDLIAEFRRGATPAENALITDLFDKITLYDIKSRLTSFMPTDEARRQRRRWRKRLSSALSRRCRGAASSSPGMFLRCSDWRSGRAPRPSAWSPRFGHRSRAPTRTISGSTGTRMTT